jgi:hypothetical protein
VPKVPSKTLQFTLSDSETVEVHSEFTQTLRPEIKWAQDPQSDCIKDAKDLVIAPDPDLFRQEHASQKSAKEKLLQTQHEIHSLMSS